MLSLLKSGVLKTNKAASEQIRSASPNPVVFALLFLFFLSLLSLISHCSAYPPGWRLAIG